MSDVSAEIYDHEREVQKFFIDSGLTRRQATSLNLPETTEIPVGLEVLDPNDPDYIQASHEDQVVDKVTVQEAFNMAFDRQRLSQREATTLFRHVVMGETMDQIGERQGVSRTMIYNVEKRAKDKLQSCLFQLYTDAPLEETVVKPVTLAKGPLMAPPKLPAPKPTPAKRPARPVPQRTTSRANLTLPARAETSRPANSRREMIMAVLIGAGIGLLAGIGIIEATQPSPSTNEPSLLTVEFDDLGGGSSIIQVYPGVQSTEADQLFSGTFQAGQTADAECKTEGRLVQSNESVGEQPRSSNMWVRLHTEPGNPQYATTVYLQNPGAIINQLPDC